MATKRHLVSDQTYKDILVHQTTICQFEHF